MNAIKTAIAEQYIGRRWFQFWPRQFVTSVSPEPDVLDALREMVVAGDLRPEVTVFCEDGHPAWTGSPAEMHLRVGHPCPECDLPISDESPELKFVMTKSWCENLDLGALVQKKA